MTSSIVLPTALFLCVLQVNVQTIGGFRASTGNQDGADSNVNLLDKLGQISAVRRSSQTDDDDILADELVPSELVARAASPSFRLGKRGPSFRLGKRQSHDGDERGETLFMLLDEAGDGRFVKEIPSEFWDSFSRHNDLETPFDDISKKGPSFRLGKRGPSFRLGKRGPSFRLGKRGPSFRLGKRGPSFRLGKRLYQQEAANYNGVLSANPVEVSSNGDNGFGYRKQAWRQDTDLYNGGASNERRRRDVEMTSAAKHSSSPLLTLDTE